MTSNAPLPPDSAPPDLLLTDPLLPDLLLGLGLVHVAGERSAREGPLLVPATPGVRVLGPPPVARALVRAYVLALLDRLPVGRIAVTEGSGSVELRAGAHNCRLEVAARGGQPGKRLRSGPAEVWLAPEGHACARAAGEARGLWVPVSVRFAPGPLAVESLLPLGHIRQSHVPQSHFPQSHVPQSHVPQSHVPQSHVPPSDVPPSDVPPSDVPPSRVPPRGPASEASP